MKSHLHQVVPELNAYILSSEKELRGRAGIEVAECVRSSPDTWEQPRHPGWWFDCGIQETYWRQPGRLALRHGLGTNPPPAYDGKAPQGFWSAVKETCFYRFRGHQDAA